MEGVTTAIVAFLLVCVVFPVMVKNKPQYYAAFAAMVIIIMLSGLEAVVSTPAFRAFATFMIALLQVAALILLILSAGGLTLRQLTGDVTRAIEVVRRGETSKEVIVPLPRDFPVTAAQSLGVGPAKVAAPRVILSDADSSVPME